MFDERLSNLDEHLEAMRDAGIESVPEMPSAWQVRMAELKLEGEGR